jgi:IS5 family transposase
MLRMKQTSLGLGNSTKRTRKREFLMDMERVVPWAALVELVAPLTPATKAPTSAPMRQTA